MAHPLRALLLASACFLLLHCASAIEVSVSNGSVEVVQEKWRTTLYVRQYDTTTKTFRRLDNFFWTYNIDRVAEYWVTEKSRVVNATTLAHNYTLLDYEHLATETSYVEKMDDGQDAQCFERRVPLPNGAKIIQKMYTFATDTFKNVAGWKLHLNPKTVKIVTRVEDWPQTAVPFGVNPAVNPRKILLRGTTLTSLLPREDSSVDWTKWPQPIFFDSLPFYIYKDKGLTEPVVSTQVPENPIGAYDYEFRHRYFTLKTSFLQNSTRCADAKDESTCVWLDLDVAGLSQESEIDMIRNHLAPFLSQDWDPNVQFNFPTDLYIGMIIGEDPVAEWDPNLDLVFGSNFDTTFSSPATAQLDAQNAQLAVYVAVPIAVVAIIAGCVGVVIWRRHESHAARVKVARIMSTHQARDSVVVDPSPAPLPTASYAPVNASRGWQKSSTPNGELRNTIEEASSSS